jgi:CheY-like chemotaxis protein
VPCRDILVVEDDQDISDSLRDLLEGEGYRVATAANGREGIDALRRQGRHPCVVLLDLMMPVMNGWQFLEAKGKDEGIAPIPVVVVSAYRDKAASVATETVGFVIKPIDVSKLLDVVHRLCPV